MAIRIPILTSFDPKGLKQANAQFAKLQTSIGSLGRNFAIAGTAIVAGTALLGKAVKSASNFEAEFEGVNQVFGEAAKSVQRFAEQAAQSAGLSATEALQASKTFGLFATGAGLGAAEAANFSTTMVQLAGDLGSFNDVPTADALAAIQSGLMGQSEPLRKFGVFLDDARLKAEALNMGIYNGTGPLSTQQKMMASYSAILAQTTVQQGDFVKYQDTLGNQLKTISTEFDNLTKDIGLMLIPAITEAMPQIKEMARQLGTELKAAIASVDWVALTKTIVDLARFFSQNAGIIMQVVTAIFALNTAFKLMAVASGIAQTAIALQTWMIAQLATGMTVASVALKVFRTALITTGVGALVVGLGFLIEALINSNDEATKAAPAFDAYGTAIRQTGTDADWAATKYGVATTAVKNYNNEVGKVKVPKLNPRQADAAAGIFDTGPKTTPTITTPTPVLTTGAGGIGQQIATVNSVLTAGTREASRTAKLLAAGVSEGLASLIVSTATTSKAFKKELAKVSTDQGLAKMQARFNKTAAGQQEIAASSAAAAQAAAQAAAELAAAQQAAADREAAALAERERVYQSFADSVKNTFAGIKNSIIGAFDLTQLGGSTNAITRNMEKLLTRLRSFATNVKSLATMGLNPALLQQIISAGPLGGARLAEGLVMGGQAGLSAINAGYSEFGALSGQIAETGTQSLFGTGAQQTVYNINVDGGVGSGSTIGKAIVDAIKAYERTSGAVWQGA
jgi:hypothetical protein